MCSACSSYFAFTPLQVQKGSLGYLSDRANVLELRPVLLRAASRLPEVGGGWKQAEGAVPVPRPCIQVVASWGRDVPHASPCCRTGGGPVCRWGV